MPRFSLIVSFAAFAVAAPLGAQQLGPSRVPEGHKPPPGMCRIWIDGVPPGRQAAPTDCATAVRNRPSNGRVIWGDDLQKRRDDGPDRPTGERETRRTPTGREVERPRSAEPRETPKAREEGESPKPPETRERSRAEPKERRPDANQRKPEERPERRRPSSGNPSERRKPDPERRPD